MNWFISVIIFLTITILVIVSLRWKIHLHMIFFLSFTPSYSYDNYNIHVLTINTMASLINNNEVHLWCQKYLSTWYIKVVFNSNQITFDEFNILNRFELWLYYRIFSQCTFQYNGEIDYLGSFPSILIIGYYFVIYH